VPTRPTSKKPPRKVVASGNLTQYGQTLFPNSETLKPQIKNQPPSPIRNFFVKKK